MPDYYEVQYKPRPVRPVLIPKKQPGKYRPLGIPCLRDRVAQTSTMLVLSPIFEADLQPEPYGYRPERSAKDAVRRIHRLLNTGHRSVIDADWSHYFGEIPHAERMKSLARRISDGRMLGLIKRWLIMAVVEDNGHGDNRHTNRARRERKGTPQGSPISPLLSNIYMRRILLGWKLLGHARRFGTEIVAYADDFCVLGKAPPAEMMQVVTRLMGKLKLPLNAQKTRCLPCPEESFAFLGYRIGGHYRPKSGRRSLGTRPSKASVQSICRRIRAQTDAEIRDYARRGDGSTSQRDDIRLGARLHPRAGASCLPDHRPARDAEAATVVLSEAQDGVQEVRALLKRTAVGALRPDPSCAYDPKPSVGEGSTGGCNLIGTTVPLRRGDSDGTMTRTCRATGEALLAPVRNCRRKVGTITGGTGKCTEGERVAERCVVAMNRGNARGAKAPHCWYVFRQ